MRTRLHRFLLMLLMLGLPVQTFAATSMLVCASAHQTLPVQHMASADDAMAGCHESEPVPPPSHDCKHCSLCVLASALPIPATETARWIDPTSHFQALAVGPFSGFIPDGPERPPRTSLA